MNQLVVVEPMVTLAVLEVQVVQEEALEVTIQVDLLLHPKRLKQVTLEDTLQ
jgi:hypothetical protein